MRSAAAADFVQHRGDASLLAAKLKPARAGANAAALHAAAAHTTATALADTIDHTAKRRSGCKPSSCYPISALLLPGKSEEATSGVTSLFN
jgi:hypothetical protein